MNKRVTLIIGGARSGKSSYAEKLVCSNSGKRLYLATAEAFDEEMKKRIALHKKMREGKFHQTIEEPIDLFSALHAVDKSVDIILIDCMTVWLGNLLHHYGERDSYPQIEQFLTYLSNPAFEIVIVTNEVGEGIIPATPFSRHFVDHAGWLNQALGRIADEVIMMVAGIPLKIKGA